MTKVYLAHAISTRGEYDDSKRVANEIRSLGYEVYAAAENDSINDKTNNPTPIDIYNGDVSEILSSDIIVVNEIRSVRYEVYAAAENDSINYKTNNSTPIDIYNGDVSEILSSDIFVVNLSGGHQDGTISEIGLVSGVNEERYDSGKTTIPIKIGRAHV